MQVNLESLAKIFIESPWFIGLLFFTALATSFVFLRITKRDIGLPNRNIQIDGLRGFLAISVFIHHTYINFHYVRTGFWSAPEPNYFNQVGQMAVAFFFMITGYLFFGKISNPKWKADWLKLYIGRVFRLGPLYLAVVVLLIIMSFVYTNFHLVDSFFNIAQNALGWLSFTLFNPTGINGAPTALFIAGVNWTLPYEWLFYFCLPFLYLLVRGSQKTLWKVIGFSFVFLGVAVFVYFDQRIDLLVACYFLGGIVASIISKSRFGRVLSAPGFGWVPIILVLGVAIFFHGSYQGWPIVLLSIAFIVISSGNSLFGLLKVRSIIWLGEISYSTYLVHGLLVTILLRFVFGGGSDLTYVGLSLLAAVLVVLVSSWSYLSIERSGMALGNKISKSESKTNKFT